MRKQLEFQQVIGYEFIHSGLLVQALTHSSYANERRMRKHSDNERLEFLGDAVLEIIASEFLYHHFPDLPEGELTKMRASLVCEQTLAACTKELDLGSYLLLGRGEQQTGGEGIAEGGRRACGQLYRGQGFFQILDRKSVV